MWTAKIQFDGSLCTFGQLCIKTKIGINGYPLYHKYRNNELTVVIIGTFSGKQEATHNFINLAKNAKDIVNFEATGNIFICKFLEKSKLREIYNSEIIFLEPYNINQRGEETLNIASFDRNQITNIYKTLNKFYSARLISINQRKVNYMSRTYELPKITEIQKEAIIFASNEGYYDFPRKTSLKDLAKKKKLSFSTFQAHLRKAEKKLIPFWLK